MSDTAPIVFVVSDQEATRQAVEELIRSKGWSLRTFAPAEELPSKVLREAYQSLTRREQEVMELVVCGYLNKQVGSELGISETTVKAHRGKVMQKMRAGSLAELVRMAVGLQLRHRSGWQAIAPSRPTPHRCTDNIIPH